MDLACDQFLLHVGIRKPDLIHNAVFFGVPDQGHSFVFTEMVNHQVVTYPQNPGQEFPLLLVTTGTKCLNDFNECFLEQILRQFFISDQYEDGSKTRFW